MGGSLLDLPDLHERLKFLLNNFDSDCNLIVAGGGTSVRELESKNTNLSPIEEHWASLAIMNANTLAIKTFFNGSSFASAVLAKKPSVMFLDAVKFCKSDSTLEGKPFLPERNDVRSDSIALRIAQRFQFDRLFLLKSCDCPNSSNWEELSRLHYVDPFFCKLIKISTNKLNIHCINLRNIPRDKPFQFID